MNRLESRLIGSKESYQPLSGLEVPRFAGISTFMRLPYLEPEKAGGEIDIALLGIPFDAATTNRPGTRHGPRQVREASSLMRPMNEASHVSPYRLCSCADVGDIAINPIDIPETMRRIEAFIRALYKGGVMPLSVGGDHLISYPILRVLGAEQPLGMVHFDAHSDTGDSYYGGSRLAHGTPFRRAIEDGVLDPRRCVQIGIRGTIYSTDEYDWARAQGVRIITTAEVVEKGIPFAIQEARSVVGDEPTYFTFDIDCIDPAYAPGTGTPEIGGFTTREALQLVRGFRHLNLVGGDVVEVSPPFDHSGVTALAGATIAFEILCLLAEAKVERYRK